METFTVQDMLMNSTDLYKILCTFGIKNISQCEDEEDYHPEPKGGERTINVLSVLVLQSNLILHSFKYHLLWPVIVCCLTLRKMH